MSIKTASKYHDFSYGHCVTGHKGFDKDGNETEVKGKCYNLHGHNGRVTFYCGADKVDSLGRVVDFSVIGAKLCQWVENNWDHKFLIWSGDKRLPGLKKLDEESLVVLEYNPTAANLSDYLLCKIAPKQLEGTNVRCIKVVFEETRKCKVEVSSEKN